MLSQRQAVALRAVIVDAFATRGAGEPSIPAAAVAWSEQDLPAEARVGITVQRLGFTPTSLDGERQHRANAAGDALVRSTREPGELSLSIVLRSRASSSAPHHHQDAGYLLGRVLLHLASEEATHPLELAGCPLLRRGTVRPLSSLLRGSQWTSAAALDVVLGLSRIDVREVGWISSASGEGDVGSDPVVAWDTRS